MAAQELDPADHRLQQLSQTMRAFAEATADLRTLANTICAHLTMHVSGGAALALLSDDAKSLLPTAIHLPDAEARERASALLGSQPAPLDGERLIARVARSRTSALYPRVDHAQLAREVSPEFAELAQREGLSSLMSLPLLGHGQPLGVLTLLRLGSDAAPFTPGDQAVIQLLAEHAALALSNARLLQSLQSELGQRTRAEEQARRFEALTQHSADFIAMAGLDGRILFINEAGRKLLGISPDTELASLQLVDFHTDAGMKRAAVIRATGRWQGDGQLRHAVTGELIDTQVTSFLLRTPMGEPFGFATVQRDVRETRRMESSLRLMQKLEAVGRLASGFAHDFNNLLLVMQGTLSHLRARPGADRELSEGLDQVLGAVQSASVLTRSLLAFGRRSVMEPVVLDVGSLAERVSGLLGRLLGDQVQTRLQLSSEPVRVFADAAHLEQVLVNLMVNARDAMPEGGTVTLSTARRTFENGEAAAHGAEPEVKGVFVGLAVTDTGVGMGAELRERIFEPFFTTKPQGKGTGMGLAIAYGIVKQQGGFIEVQSAPGRGSTFTVWLPATDRPAPRTERAEVAVPRGKEAIVVVEDRESSRVVVTRLLLALGYRVAAFGSATEVRNALAKPDAPEMDLLFADVVLPDGNGAQLAAELVAARPGLKLLLSTGRGAETELNHGLAEAPRVLAKPYSIEVLAQAVRAALDGPAPHPATKPKS